MPGQTVQTQIRLLLEEQSDQGLHGLPFLCIVWTHYSVVEPHSSNFRVITTKFLGVRIFRKITVAIRNKNNVLKCKHLYIVLKEMNRWFKLYFNCLNYKNTYKKNITYPGSHKSWRLVLRSSEMNSCAAVAQYPLKFNQIIATVMILSFRTDMLGQTMQTQIRLLLEEQSDQGLHCLPFHLHRLDSLLYGRAT